VCKPRVLVSYYGDTATTWIAPADSLAEIRINSRLSFFDCIAESVYLDSTRRREQLWIDGPANGEFFARAGNSSELNRPNLLIV